MCCKNGFPISVCINCSYNENTKMYQIAIFNNLSYSIDIFQGDFTENILILEDTKISFTDEKNPSRTCKQFVYIIIDGNSFNLENKVSQYEGKTRNPQAIFTYTHKTDYTIPQK